MESFQGLIRNKRVFHSYHQIQYAIYQRQLYIAVDKQLQAEHETSKKDMIQIVYKSKISAKKQKVNDIECEIPRKEDDLK